MTISDSATNDLDTIGDYIEQLLSRERAAQFAHDMTERIGRLATMPQRGSVPQEAVELGLVDYRQTVLDRNRIIYKVTDDQMYIVLVADGRRDMRVLLADRLINR